MAFDFACLDWEDRLKAGLPPIPDLDLDEAAAGKAVAIFDEIRLPDVDGQPTMGEACGDWFRGLVRAAFGSADPETGENRVGEIFCLVPKKNSKTTNSAALGLTALLMNETPHALMMIVGPTKDVADTCFGQIAGMIEADPEDPETGRSYLKDRFNVREGTQEIVDRWTKATLAVKSFDRRVVTGKIPKLVIIDELHVLGGNAYAAKVLTQLRGGMITRPDTLLLIITTQSDEPPKGVFRSELKFAREVRDGMHKGGNLLPMLYEFPEAIQSSDDKAWRDPRLWPLVLPNLGRSITLPRLQGLYKKALAKGIDEELVWATQHLNVQIGIGTHAETWVGASLWPVHAEKISLDQLIAQSDCICAGIDGGGLDDLLGLGLIGRHAQTRRWYGWVRAWAQTDVLVRRPDIASQLEDFEKAGELVICRDDPQQDLREVAEICAKVRDAGLLPKKYGIGLDPAGITALVDELAEQNIEGDVLTEISQGWRLSPAIMGLGRKLKDGSFVPCGQGLLTWCVGNAKAEDRGNAQAISKAVAGRAKIDPLVGIFNAAMLMARNPDAEGSAPSSPFDDPDFDLNNGGH